MKIQDAKMALKELNRQIKTILHNSGFESNNGFYPDEYETNRKLDRDGFEVADLTADEWQLVYECEHILDKLDNISERIDYLSQPITHKGKLYRTTNDRYAVDGVELCCGYRVEYQQYDKEHECYYWIIDRIEYSDKYDGYYFYSSKEPCSEGKSVRIRW